MSHGLPPAMRRGRSEAVDLENERHGKSMCSSASSVVSSGALLLEGSSRVLAWLGPRYGFGVGRVSVPIWADPNRVPCSRRVPLWPGNVVLWFSFWASGPRLVLGFQFDVGHA